ncbi:MAG: SRPBCC family protein [Candidatus Hodarchaeales archaeon]|jgi:uncharacterized protein YndB with AHSA1/START domain
MTKKLTVEKDITITADISRVWNALTNPKLTKQYFLNCEAISDWNTGDPIIFKMISEGKEVVPVKGLILRIKKGELLEYTCFAPEFEKDTSRHTQVKYQLSKTETGTKLFVSQGKFNKEEQFNHTSENWDIVLNGLKTLVEKQTDKE